MIHGVPSWKVFYLVACSFIYFISVLQAELVISYFLRTTKQESQSSNSVIQLVNGSSLDESGQKSELLPFVKSHHQGEI